MIDIAEVARHHAERNDVSGVAVVGTGPGSEGLAEHLAAKLGHGTAMVVVVSNDPADIRAGFEMVDDLGVVVLVCDDPPAGVTVDIYGDLHARSLTVVGVRQPQR